MQRCWGNSSSHCTWYLLSYYLYEIYNFLCFFLYFFDLVLACPQNFSILLVAQFFCWLQLCSGLRTRAIKAIKNQQQHPKIYIVPQNLPTSLHKIELSLWPPLFSLPSSFLYLRHFPLIPVLIVLFLLSKIRVQLEVVVDVCYHSAIQNQVILGIFFFFLI